MRQSVKPSEMTSFASGTIQPAKLNPMPKKTKTWPKVDNSDGVVKCQWHLCRKKATKKILRANTHVCDEHYSRNCYQFNRVLDYEPVKARRPQSKKGSER